MKIKKLTLVSLLLLVIASFFWTQSRYPQLDEKAAMSGETPTSGISFDVVMEIAPEDSAYKKIGKHTVNWIDTNKKGMTFGLLFAAALILLFSIVSKHQFKNRWLNSLTGVLIGAPLGVCVNCAAPIAKGIRSSGGRTETALAAMISSPTLNLVVLSMLFAMYPSYIVAIKLFFTFILLMVGVPLLSMLFSDDDNQLKAPTQKPSRYIFQIDDHFRGEETDKWSSAIKWTIINYLKSLWYIFKVAVPLMLLAGLIGAILITFLPLEGLAEFTYPTSKLHILLALLVVALIGTALPVPMAFDVIIVSILMTLGLETKYAVTLLFTLGCFSIYSYLIVSVYMSKRIALGLFAIVVFLGMSGGVLAHFYEKHVKKAEIAGYMELFKQSKQEPKVFHYSSSTDRKITASQLNELLNLNEPHDIARSSDGTADLELMPFRPKVGKSNVKFKKIEGSDIGIDPPYQYSSRDILLDSFSNSRAIASGDVHNDNWPDIVVASGGKIYLYANLKNKQFSRQPLETPGETNVMGVTFVDIDNDGWQDVFFTTFLKGNYVAYNKSGNFDLQNIEKLPHPEGMVYTIAPAFGDLSGNGTLDMAWGNMSSGIHGSNSYNPQSKNFLLKNNDGKWNISAIHEGKNGETLTTLLSDFDLDGYTDLIVGNDFFVPDYFYLGGKDIPLSFTSTDSLGIYETTRTTMSYISADIDNDLTPEIFSVQTSLKREKTSHQDLTREIESKHHKNLLAEILDHQEKVAKALITNEFSECPQDDLFGCIGNYIFSRKLPIDLGKNFGFVNAAQDFEIGKEEMINGMEYPPQVHPNKAKKGHGTSVLLKKTDAGYSNVNQKFGIRETGFAWNAKFADLDNDQWSDLYINNGFILYGGSYWRNYFYRNENGVGFSDQSLESGLDTILPSGSSLFIDYDRDGDLDIVVIPAIGPLMLYENLNHENNSIAFSLKDNHGNHFGINAKIYIHYNGQSQYKEVLLSGGFKSFDEPVVYFGLSDNKKVDKIEIKWSNGSSSTFKGQFHPGMYTVVRK